MDEERVPDALGPDGAGSDKRPDPPRRQPEASRDLRRRYPSADHGGNRTDWGRVRYPCRLRSRITRTDRAFLPPVHRLCTVRAGGMWVDREDRGPYGVEGRYGEASFLGVNFAQELDVAVLAAAVLCLPAAFEGLDAKPPQRFEAVAKHGDASVRADDAEKSGMNHPDARDPRHGAHSFRAGFHARRFYYAAAGRIGKRPGRESRTISLCGRFQTPESRRPARSGCEPAGRFGTPGVAASAGPCGLAWIKSATGPWGRLPRAS
jgi:hypothetical protein